MGSPEVSGIFLSAFDLVRWPGAVEQGWSEVLPLQLSQCATQLTIPHLRPASKQLSQGLQEGFRLGKNRKESIGIEPRGLSVPQGAAYYGISPNAYRRLMREGTVPQPIKIPGLDRQIIDKLQLDAVLDALSKGAA